MSSEREAASGSAGVRVFTAGDVHRLLTYPSAIQALERAFATLEGGTFKGEETHTATSG